MLSHVIPLKDGALIHPQVRALEETNKKDKPYNLQAQPKGENKGIFIMLGFRSTITNKVDAKGRVSVPAKFRAIIEAENLNSPTEAGSPPFLICYRAVRVPAIEAGGRRLLEKNDSMLDELRERESDYDQAESLEYVLHGGSVDLSFDSEGRVLLPEDLREHAGITDAATFVGLGIRFHVWNPDAYKEEFKAAKKIAYENRNLLRPSRSLSSGGGL